MSFNFPPRPAMRLVFFAMLMLIFGVVSSPMFAQTQPLPAVSLELSPTLATL